MSTEPTPIDPWHYNDGPSADRLVGEAMAAPGLPAELRASLGARLDREFARQHDPLLAARNGTLAKLLQKKHAWADTGGSAPAARDELSRLRHELHDLAMPAAPRGATWRRAALAGAAAAVLLVCVLNQPGYRWRQVVDAVRQQPFVSVLVEGDSVPRVLTTRREPRPPFSPTTASYINLPDEVVRQLRPQSNPVEPLLPNPRSPQAVERDLLALLIGDGAPGQENSPGVTVLQARPRLEGDAVRLELTLERGGRRLTARLLLDAATKLPRECVLVDVASGAAPRRLTFSYPDQDLAGVAPSGQ